MYSGLYCVFFVALFSSPFVLVYYDTPLVYFCSIDPVLTAQQIKALQKRNAQLEDENLILKKPLRFSRHTQTKVERRQASIK